MWKNRRVVVCVPSGRKRFLGVLMPYLLGSQANIVDEIQLWINTDVLSDIDFIRSLEQRFPKVRCVVNDGIILHTTYYDTPVFNDSVCFFYRKTIEPNTIYVKLDDDMCWIHQDFFTNLCNELLAVEQRCLFVAGNVFNIALTSKIYQQMGIIGTEAGVSTGDPRCPIACIDGKFAKYIHECFIELYHMGVTEKLYFDSFELNGRVRIGAIAYTGETFAKFGGIVGAADEKELTQVIAPRLGMPMRVCGNALVSHFASAHQRALLEDETNILEQYQAIATNETGVVV